MTLQQTREFYLRNVYKVIIEKVSAKKTWQKIIY